MEKDLLVKSHQPTYNSGAGLNESGGEGYMKGQSSFSWLSLRYGHTRKCVSNKAALLILLWSFVLGLWNGLVLSPDALLLTITYYNNTSFLPGFGVVAIIMCFFPLAGFLADVKYGRYKVVVRSLLLVLISAVLLVVVAGPLVGCVVKFVEIKSDTIEGTGNFLIVLITFISLCGLLALIMSGVGMVGFTANVVQFGMDQLHDSPGEDRTLFIHWYVWVYYLSAFTGQLGWSFILCAIHYNLHHNVSIILGSTLLGSTPLVVIVVIAATLCLVRYKRRWFLIEPGTFNPYKLVYRVTKFARQHKVPVNRSAFTYCEDKVPKGLDLGKDKYGGPFTTEEVENVKAFYGILKVLFSFGIIFSLDFAAESLLEVYALHTSFGCEGNFAKYFLFNTGLFSLLLTVTGIPLYLCLLRPLISRYNIPMLKRMGLGILLAVLSVTVFMFMDIAAHEIHKSKDLRCMFEYYTNYVSGCFQDPAFLIFPMILMSLSYMLFYPAAFEFICSQSPHSMKGLLIGLFYTVKGVYQTLATIVVVPFAAGLLNSVAPSCGFYYYLTNIVLGILGFALFTYVSKKYKFRERDEPSNIHIYAEEYYSRTQNIEEDCDYTECLT